MRGNINKKYLRRRKSWLQRNIGWIAVIAVVAICAVIGVLFGVDVLIKQFGDKKNDLDKVNEPTESQIVREVKWIEETEPVRDEVSYIPPENIKLPYFIKVNRVMNCVTVYGIDDAGAYTIPVKSFVCSTGLVGKETVLGENFTASDKYNWGTLAGNTYGQYVFRINGQYLFQSVPYLTAVSSNLEPAQFNKLGTAASTGSVWLCVADVKWIYDNCPAGTKVTIYDDETMPGPLGKPEMIKIPEASPNAGWDPTDPDVNNPWKSYHAEIKGAADITAKIGEAVNIKSGVTAVDTCGNDITDRIVTIGKYTFDQVGEYVIKYQVVDAIGSKDEVSIKLKVVE